MKSVGITGGSGFIGSYITRKFLNNDYNVKVAVTDIAKSDKYEHLFELGNEDKLSIKALDVQDLKALKSFAENCEILIHCGTPFKLGVENPEKELYEPTIHGTENLLEIASKSNGLEKLVFVASVAAFNTSFPYPVAHRDSDHLYTEQDDPHLDEANIPYAQAKYFADQRVRKYIDKHPEISTEIVSLSPVSVMGNPLSGREDSTSVGLQQLFKANKPHDAFTQVLFREDVEFALVDVEDVAEAVYRAATIKGNHGRNYLLSSESWRISDISKMLNGEEPVGNARMVYSNNLAKEELGIDFKPAIEPLKRFSER